VQDGLQLLHVFSVLNAEKVFCACVDVYFSALIFYLFIYVFKNMLFMKCTKD
jgi:hypothetical protein